MSAMLLVCSVMASATFCTGSKSLHCYQSRLSISLSFPGLLEDRRYFSQLPLNISDSCALPLYPVVISLQPQILVAHILFGALLSVDSCSFHLTSYAERAINTFHWMPAWKFHILARPVKEPM